MNKRQMKQSFFVKEIWCSRKAGNAASTETFHIYGKAYIPAAEGRYPLLIFSHELGKNHEAGIPYAERLAAAGYAVYTFDYCGGTVFCGRDGRIVRQRHSSGETTDASLMTWTEDLAAVLLAAGSWDFVDPARICLIGGSQGAVASALTACRTQAAGLILLYPPLDLPERMHTLFHDREEIPERFDLFDGWILLGRRYAEDVWDLDVYRELAGYRGNLLILHGDQDDVVDISVSEKAVPLVPDCRFYRIRGGRHGFKGEAFEDACSRILTFLGEVFEGS